VIRATTDGTTGLARLALELVGTPSESEREDAVLALIQAAMPGEPDDDEDSCLLYLPPAAERRVVLAGHVDTVPIAGAAEPSLRHGELVGRGAADMKGGCAVAIELAGALASGEVPTELGVGFLFFGREEIPSERSPLPGLFERNPALAATDLIVMMEPTANALEVGCLGNLDAVLHVRGVAAHSARPWLGDNAIHRAAEAVRRVAERPHETVDIGGLAFREVMSVTQIEGGVAPNVVPDRVRATVNHRYAPSRSPAEAERILRELVDDLWVDVEVRSNAAPAPVVVDSPLVQRLRAVGDLEVRPKQAWTPVAEFAAHGLDAVNFGPGDPALAHRDDERVSLVALGRSFDVLRRFVVGDA
jgi:succinyl-diaminopimelate desuccinylase